MINKPMPFKEAIGFILNKEIIPESEWDAQDWRDQEDDVSLRAFWSSRVENARFLDRAQAFLFDTLANTTEKVVGPDGVERIALRGGDRATFVRRMREFMIKEGMVTDEEEFFEVDQKDITDIRSEERLRLIYDTNIRQAYGYGQWKQGQTPAILRRFPAQRFVRDRQVMMERPRHSESEGEVKLKSDTAYWADYQNDPEIGGFGVPWAPFGFRSGMGLRDVNREEAIALGLDVEALKPDTTKNLNSNLSSSVKKMDPGIKAKLIAELRQKSKEAGERSRAASARRIKEVIEEKGRISPR